MAKRYRSFIPTHNGGLRVKKGTFGGPVADRSQRFDYDWNNGPYRKALEESVLREIEINLRDSAEDPIETRPTKAPILAACFFGSKLRIKRQGDKFRPIERDEMLVA